MEPQQPPAYPTGAETPPRREGTTNGFAIAALVFGLLGGILLSVIFAIVALRQIGKRGQDGKGMAIAGLVLSGCWTAIFAVGFGSGYFSLDRDASGNVTEAGSESVLELQLGDCLGEMPAEGVAFSAQVVPCSKPHEGQIYAVFDMPAGKFPGDKAISTAADRGCGSRLEGVSQAAYDDDQVEIFFFIPTTLSWSQHDREIACIAQYLDEPRTGSLITK